MQRSGDGVYPCEGRWESYLHDFLPRHHHQVSRQAPSSQGTDWDAPHWQGKRQNYSLLLSTYYRLFFLDGPKKTQGEKNSKLKEKTQNSSLKPKKSALFKNYLTFLCEKLHVLWEKHKKISQNSRKNSKLKENTHNSRTKNSKLKEKTQKSRTGLILLSFTEKSTEITKMV